MQPLQATVMNLHLPTKFKYLYYKLQNWFKSAKYNAFILGHNDIVPRPSTSSIPTL